MSRSYRSSRKEFPPAEPAGPPGRAAWLNRITERIVLIAWHGAPVVVLLALALAAVLGWYALNHLGMDTKTNRLLDPNLDWRKDEIALNQAFPQEKNVFAVVVQGATPELADKGASELAPALARDSTHFKSVTYLEGTEFFRRNALLLLPKDQVASVIDQISSAQGLLGTLAQDPTLHGLFSALNLALEQVQSGDMAPGPLVQPLTTFSTVIESRLEGRQRYVSWGKLFTGRDPMPRELNRVVTVKPVLDYGRLSPGRPASDQIRRTAKEIGLTPDNGVSVAMTGDVALADEEFASVREGTGIATAVSLVVVLIILYIAIRSVRPIFAILVTLLCGLAATFAFAAASVHELNLISVAFVVLFIGIAVDFGIQFTVRFRDAHAKLGSSTAAARQTGYMAGGALLLAAITTAIGFIAFEPTPFRGVSELGLIAGAGMIIALLLNLTLLPALLRLVRLTPEEEPPGLLRNETFDTFLVERRAYIIALAVGLGILALVTLPSLRFDFDPFNLKDPKSESVRTLRALMAADIANPNTLEIFKPDFAALQPTAQRLKKLPEVDRVMSLATFVPSDQDEKISIISDAAFVLSATLESDLVPPASSAETIATLQETVRRLRAVTPKEAEAATVFRRIADALEKAIAGPDPSAKLAVLQDALLRGLPERLSALSQMLKPEPITLQTLPAELRGQWIDPQGRYRLRVFPTGDATDNKTLRHFVSAVRGVEPSATGNAYFIQKSGEVVLRSFQEAFLYALAGIVIVLLLVLRRVRDVALVVGPLIFSTVLTLATCAVLGLRLNFANVIALPLLLGIGVAFNIYFVMNWRAGLSHPLRSATARAVVFSAFATLTAFSSLALSPHAGTASMGYLLTICLLYTLASALFLLPALLGPPQVEESWP